MNEKQKKYQIPEELAKIFSTAHALRELRNIYVKIPIWGFKKAKKLAIESEIKYDHFWTEIIRLYPELIGKKYQYMREERRIEIIKKEDEEK